jgi:hypothetical protein
LAGILKNSLLFQSEGAKRLRIKNSFFLRASMLSCILGNTVRISYRSIILGGAMFMAAVCNARGDDEIRAYTVPKETSPVAATPDIPVNAAPVQWTAPDSWQKLTPTSIRLGNFVVPGQNGKKAEVTVTSFPGAVGTELDNVNRWRRELGLEPVEQSGVSSEAVTVDGSEGKLFDLAGASARTVVAMIPHNSAMWFFKIRGDAEVVGAARAAFSDFLKSVHFSGAVEEVPPPANVASSALPPPAPPVAADVAPDMPQWKPPTDWTETEPGPMIFKKFSISDPAGAKAAVSISFFPGDVGGVFANVNRWRGQMGLSPLEADRLASVTETVETAGGKATLVDFTGTDAKTGQLARLIGAIVPHGEQTWFYKLLGSSALVGKEKDGFVQFVKGVHYP